MHGALLVVIVFISCVTVSGTVYLFYFSSAAFRSGALHIPRHIIIITDTPITDSPADSLVPDIVVDAHRNLTVETVDLNITTPRHVVTDVFQHSTTRGPSSPVSVDHDHASRPGKTTLTPAVASDRVSSHPEREAPVRGFLLSVSVDQQLTGGLKGFTQLATLAAIFNLSTVEPYVQGSKLVGVPQLLSQGDRQDVMRLSDLYDWEDLRRKFKTCSTRNDHLFSSFKTFLGSASRDVILVYMIKTPAEYDVTFSGSNDKVVEGSPNVTLLASLKLLNIWARNASQEDFTAFRLSRVILVDARPTYALPLSVIKKDLGSVIDRQVSKYQSATVMFVNWRAVTLSTVARPSYYFIPGFYWRPCQSIDYIKHSQAVIYSSKLFSQSLNDNNANATTVGIHIRGERLLKEYNGDISHCFQELEILLHSITSNVSRLGVRIVHDLGEYGTMSCLSGVCSKKRKTFISQIQSLGYPVVSFKPANFTFVPNSPGFVAFVEGEYLSNVDILVTLGWGGFQNVIVQRFVRQHGGKSDYSHRICSSPSQS